VIPPSGFPVNYALLDTLEAKADPDVVEAKKAIADGDQPCLDCDAPATHHFQTCGDLCSECLRAAHSRRSTSSHVVCDIKSKPKPVPVCSQHKLKPVELYCMKCEMLVCLLCPFSLHQGHDCKEINQAWELKKTAIRESSKFSQPGLTRLRLRQSQVEKAQKQLVDDSKTVLNAITEHTQTVVNAVRQREQKMKDDLAALSSTRKQHLDSIQLQCASKIVTLDKLDQDIAGLCGMEAMSGLERCGSLVPVVNSSKQEYDTSEQAIKEGPPFMM